MGSREIARLLLLHLLFLPELVADIGNPAERRIVHLTVAKCFSAGTGSIAPPSEAGGRAR